MEERPRKRIDKYHRPGPRQVSDKSRLARYIDFLKSPGGLKSFAKFAFGGASIVAMGISVLISRERKKRIVDEDAQFLINAYYPKPNDKSE